MRRSFLIAKLRLDKIIISLLDLSVALVYFVIHLMNMEFVYQLLLPLIKLILTLKAPITTAADDKLYDICLSF